MEYSKLLDLSTELGYRLAMSGAETFRIEESITRVLRAYEIDAEVFAIPNCLHVSIEPVIGRPLTRMRRIGSHGNDLDAVERYTNVSRRICTERPAPEIAQKWLDEAIASARSYPLWLYLIGNFLGAFGFTFLFGGGFLDALCAGICGILIGCIIRYMEKIGANQFFRLLIASFVMALPAYSFAIAGIIPNADASIIGALMLLVPGLLFTNALRDIIHGDINSGINRIVQVVLIAMAISLGTAAAWSLLTNLWKPIPESIPISNGYLLNGLAAFLGCIGFSILFNIHGPGILICTLGGVLTWTIFLVSNHFIGNDLTAYFISTVFAAVYSEIMARIRKYPAISYLVVAIFPLIPGAGVYYTIAYAVRGQMDAFSQQGFHTGAVAGVMAVAILLGSTTVRLIATRKARN